MSAPAVALAASSTPSSVGPRRHTNADDTVTFSDALSDAVESNERFEGQPPETAEGSMTAIALVSSIPAPTEQQTSIVADPAAALPAEQASITPAEAAAAAVEASKALAAPLTSPDVDASESRVVPVGRVAEPSASIVAKDQRSAAAAGAEPSASDSGRASGAADPRLRRDESESSRVTRVVPAQVGHPGAESGSPERLSSSAQRAAGAGAWGADDASVSARVGSSSQAALAGATAATPLTTAVPVVPLGVGPGAHSVAATPGAPLAAQIMPSVVAFSSSGPGEHVVTITVTPENLGPVTIRAHITADGARFDLTSPTEAGREALRALLPELRRDASGAGIEARLELASGDRGGQERHTDRNPVADPPDALSPTRIGASDPSESPALVRILASTTSTSIDITI